MAQATLKTIRLYGKLGTTFGREFKIAVKDGAEAIRALGAQLKGFRQHLADSEEKGIAYAIFYGKRNINPHEELHDPAGSDTIKIVPVLAGNKRGGLFQVILGAALIAASFMPVMNAAVWAGAKVTWGSLAFSMGTSLALGGIAQMLSPQPRTDIPDAPENTPNRSFSGPVNTVAQGGVYPLLSVGA